MKEFNSRRMKVLLLLIARLAAQLNLQANKLGSHLQPNQARDSEKVYMVKSSLRVELEQFYRMSMSRLRSSALQQERPSHRLRSLRRSRDSSFQITRVLQ